MKIGDVVVLNTKYKYIIPDHGWYIITQLDPIVIQSVKARYEFWSLNHFQEFYKIAPESIWWEGD